MPHVWIIERFIFKTWDAVDWATTKVEATRKASQWRKEEWDAKFQIRKYCDYDAYEGYICPTCGFNWG